MAMGEEGNCVSHVCASAYASCTCTMLEHMVQNRLENVALAQKKKKTTKLKHVCICCCWFAACCCPFLGRSEIWSVRGISQLLIYGKYTLQSTCNVVAFFSLFLLLLLLLLCLVFYVAKSTFSIFGNSEDYLLHNCSFAYLCAFVISAFPLSNHFAPSPLNTATTEKKCTSHVFAPWIYGFCLPIEFDKH